MCSCLHGDQTPRYLSKGLLDRFWCRRYFLFQNDFACFIQNTVERPAVSQIQSDSELVLFENLDPLYHHSANLLHCRSPFCALSASFIGSVSHPAGDRPSHPIWPSSVDETEPRSIIRSQHLLYQGSPTGSERSSLSKDCGWKDGDRGGSVKRLGSTDRKTKPS